MQVDESSAGIVKNRSKKPVRKSDRISKLTYKPIYSKPRGSKNTQQKFSKKGNYKPFKTQNKKWTATEWTSFYEACFDCPALGDI